MKLTRGRNRNTNPHAKP